MKFTAETAFVILAVGALAYTLGKRRAAAPAGAAAHNTIEQTGDWWTFAGMWN